MTKRPCPRPWYYAISETQPSVGRIFYRIGDDTVILAHVYESQETCLMAAASVMCDAIEQLIKRGPYTELTHEDWQLLIRAFEKAKGLTP